MGLLIAFALGYAAGWAETLWPSRGFFGKLWRRIAVILPLSLAAAMIAIALSDNGGSSIGVLGIMVAVVGFWIRSETIASWRRGGDA